MKKEIVVKVRKHNGVEYDMTLSLDYVVAHTRFGGDRRYKSLAVAKSQVNRNSYDALSYEAVYSNFIYNENGLPVRRLYKKVLVAE